MDRDTPALANLDTLAAAEAALPPAQRRAQHRNYRAARAAERRYVDPWLLDALREAVAERRGEGKDAGAR
jgi:hypothetical protein